MRITVKHRDTEITICENDPILSKDSVATMRWGDQNIQIQETLKVMTEQVLKLVNAPNAK